MALAGLRVVRTGIIAPANEPDVRIATRRIQRRLKAATRPVDPVVRFFTKKLEQSVNYDFRVGGRKPFTWRPNRRNTHNRHVSSRTREVGLALFLAST